MYNMKKKELAHIIDYTNISQTASERDIVRLCKEAKSYKFGCICVNPTYVKLARNLLKGSEVLIGSTCGFPFGSHVTKVKVYEAERAINEGANHIDMVMNVGALKSKNYKLVERDIRAVVNLGVVSKVILEMGLLTDKEKVIACKIAANTEVDFLKTGTGFWGKARISDVKLMSKYGLVKAAGGIRTYKQVKSFLQAGASRIGTSTGIDIIKEYEKAVAICAK